MGVNGNGAKLLADETATHVALTEPSAPQTRYRDAFDFAPDAQLVTDGAGIILEANPAALMLFRCAEEFLLGKPLALFSVEGLRARFYDALGRFRQGTASDSFESCIARKGETPREVHVVARVSGGGKPHLLHWLLRDVTEWKRSEAARVELQRRLATAQEDERRRFARDLHDTTGQLLTAISLGLRSIRDAGPLPDAALKQLVHVQHLTDEMARQVHDLAARLRPTALDDLGLEAAVRHLVTSWSARTGVEIDFHAAGLTHRRLPPEVETVLFRIVQEALTNIAKYAGARHVAVAIGHSNGKALAVIEDDGVGFDPEVVSRPLTPGQKPHGSSKLGLRGMRVLPHFW